MNHFFDINFLDSDRIEKYKNILKNTLFIDFDCLEKTLGEEELSSLLEKNLYKSDLKKSLMSYLKNTRKEFIDFEKRKELIIFIFKQINFENDINEIMFKLHEISLIILAGNNINVNEYFTKQNQNYELEICLKNYLLKNFINNIYMYKDFVKSKKKEISQIQSVEKYISFKNEDDLFKGNEIVPRENKVENKRNSLLKNRKKLNLEIEKWEMIEKIFVNTEKDKSNYYEINSNVYLHILENLKENKFYVKNRDEIEKMNNSKMHDHKNNLLQNANFIKNKVRLVDLYFYERIYNNYFTLKLYFIIKMNVKEIYEQEFLSYNLFPIIYLPDVFENDTVIHDLIRYYFDNEYYNNKFEFQRGIRNICLDFSFFVIPLYNMIFTNVIKYYCEIRELTIEDFLKKFNLRNYVNQKDKCKYKYKVHEAEIKEFKVKMAQNISYIENLVLHKYVEMIKGEKQKTKKGGSKLIEEELEEYNKLQKQLLIKDEFKKRSISISERIEFNLFNQYKILEHISTTDERIFSTIENKIEYKKLIKKFITQIIQSNNMK